MKIFKLGTILALSLFAVSVQAQQVGVSFFNVEIKPSSTLIGEYKLHSNQYITCWSDDEKTSSEVRWGYNGEVRSTTKLPINLAAYKTVNVESELIDEKGMFNITNTSATKILTVNCNYRVDK